MTTQELHTQLPTHIPSPVGGAREMTVVVLNDFCHVQGGASKVAIDEAIGLASAGANVIFVGAVGPVCAELEAAPLTVICLGQHELLDVGKHPGVALQGLWNTGAARKVREILSTLPRDRTIVHLHGYTKALSSSPVKAAGDMGYAVVCTLHDFFSVCPNGAFFDYKKGTPCPRKALSVSCVAANCDKRHYVHKMFRTLRSFIQRHLGGLPTTVKHYISLSAQSEALLRPYLPASANIHRMANSIDWSRPRQSDVARNKTILYVGRLDEEKGVRLLADAAYRLGMAVTFVGDGPLKDVIAAVPRMTVTGWLPRSEVSTYIARARCLVFPSMWYETYGLVVAEAAAYGVPAIVSDVSAAAERIEEGLGGWRFRSGDVVDLIRCLQMLDDDTRVLSAGESAYSRFWAQAKGGASHAAQLVKIYRTALAF